VSTKYSTIRKPDIMVDRRDLNGHKLTYSDGQIMSTIVDDSDVFCAD